MKRILTFIFISLSVVAAAQPTSDIRARRIISDREFNPPLTDTIMIPWRIGQLAFHPGDSVFYVGIKTTPGGKHWENLGQRVGLTLGGGSSDLSVLWHKGGDTILNPLTDLFGTKNNEDLVIITNDEERIRIKTNGNTHIKDTARMKSIGTVPSDSADFEIAVFPDIQNMIRYNQAYSRSMFKWLADSAQSRNVKAMLQVGDITDWNTTAEWDTLSSQLSLITGTGLPYMFVPGNHDYGNGFNPSGRDATKYNANLGIAHYTGKPFYGGHYGTSNENFWIQFTAAGKKYVAVGLEFLPRDAVVTWADALIDSIYIADPAAEVIIVTHAYQTMFGELATDTSYYSGGTYGMSSDNSGYELWNKLIRKKANIRWVFSGHFLIPNGYAGSGLTDKLVVTGDNGNIINQIFVNYQDDVNWGDGYFLRLKFKPSKGTVDASFYSSYYNAYDTRVASYTLDDPALAVKSSMGVSGNMSVNKDLRVGGEMKVDNLHKGGILHVFEDHIVREDTNFRYIPRNYFGGDSLTVGKILLRKYTQKNDPLFYVNDSLGNRTFEMRSQTKDGIASLFMGVGAGRNWNTHRTDIYTESGSIGIGNENLFKLDSGFAVTSIGDRAFHEARSILFATGFGRAVGYSVLRGSDFDLFGNSAAATATEINRSVFFGSDAGALITGKIEGATVIGVGAARQGTKVDSSAIYGRGAVRNSTSAKRAVIAGFEAAQNQTNVDDMLWIHNSNSTSPLLSGKFNDRWIKIDGDLTVMDTLTATTMGLSDSSDRAATTKWVKQQLYGSGGGGGGMSNPMTTTGDVIYSSDGSGTPARLGIGTEGQVLMSNGSTPYWADPSGGYGLTKGTTTIASSATRRILYDSSGVLSNNGLLTYNSNGELQIGSATDEGDYVLQATGDVVFRGGASGVAYTYYKTATHLGSIRQDNSGQMFINGSSTTLFGSGGTMVMQIYNGKAYFASGGGTGSARVEIAAGSTSVAPFALTAGTNKSTAQNGSFEYNGTNFFVTRAGNARENLLSASAVNTVSPTSPNRTISINIDGTTYYLAAKTTND